MRGVNKHILTMCIFFFLWFAMSHTRTIFFLRERPFEIHRRKKKKNNRSITTLELKTAPERLLATADCVNSCLSVCV